MAQTPKVTIMSKPSLTPSKSDLARETAAAAKFFTGAVPAIYKGKSRGATKDIAWRTNVAFWDAYDLQPAKLSVGDTAAVNAWLRIEAEGTRLLYAGKVGATSPTWNPDAPTWPLPTAPAPWKSGSKFAVKRPWNGPQTRYHTGIDLAAEAGTPVLAPEAGIIVDPDSGWDYDEKTGKGVKSIVMTTVSGFTVLIGGIRPGSSTLKAGQVVVAGQEIAEVGRYKGGDSMAHVNVYNKVLTKSQVNAQKKWMLNGAKPTNLIDPSAYLEECAMNPKYAMVGAFGEQGDGPGLVENDVEGGEQTEGEEGGIEVFAAGGRSSKKPCLDVCGFEDAAVWRAAALSYRKVAETERVRAQAVVTKGKVPTAEVTGAFKDLQVVDQFLAQSLDGMSPDEIVGALVDTCHQCFVAGSVLGSFGTGVMPGQPSPSKGGGGSMGIFMGIAAAAVIAVVAVAVVSGKRSARAAMYAALLLLPGCGPLPPSTGSSSSSASAGDASSSETSSGVTSGGGTASGDSTTSVMDATSTGASTTSSSSTGPTGSNTICACTVDADCGTNTCVSGRCMFACDNTCPVACQMGGSCEAPCDYTCHSTCTNDGTCPVCDDPTSHATEPTTG